jgi:hypothetical protein
MPRPTDDEIDEVDDRPRRRKKKRSNSNLNRYLIMGGVAATAVFVIVVAVLAILLWSRFGPEKMTAPEQYVIYNTPEDVFHVSLPKDWNFQYGGKKDLYWVSAEKGSAKIKVYESLVGSLIGDIAGAGNPDPNGPDELLPVSRVHEFKQKLVAGEYSSYHEDPPETVQTGFGKSRRSMFNGRADMQKLRGYRTTAIGALTQVSVICTCSPKDWDALEPAFTKITESVGPGSRNK